MSAFRIESDMWADPRFICLPGDATRLWVMAGSWAADHDTDGFIPTEAAASLCACINSRDLLRHGLWEKVNGGYRIIDWHPEDATPELRLIAGGAR